MQGDKWVTIILEALKNEPASAEDRRLALIRVGHIAEAYSFHGAELIESVFGSSTGEGERMTDWISVKDLLPDQLVIAFMPPNIMGLAFYRFGMWLAADSDEDRELVNVTHWMPLPEPPK